MDGSVKRYCRLYPTPSIPEFDDDEVVILSALFLASLLLDAEVDAVGQGGIWET